MEIYKFTVSMAGKNSERTALFTADRVRVVSSTRPVDQLLIFSSIQNTDERYVGRESL
jgi:hypothetical protein